MSAALHPRAAGFAPHFRRSPLTDPWEPLYFRAEDGVFQLGLMVAPAHCNARGFLHGGAICALADNAMGLACVYQQAGVSAVTAHLSVDFLAPVPPGAWVSFAASPRKLGRSLGFADCPIEADGNAAARATGVFSLIRKPQES